MLLLQKKFKLIQMSISSSINIIKDSLRNIIFVFIWT